MACSCGRSADLAEAPRSANSATTSAPSSAALRWQACALGRDGVALGRACAVGLFGGGDPQVDQCGLGGGWLVVVGRGHTLPTPSQRASDWTRPVCLRRTPIAAWETSKWRARVRVLCSPPVQARLSHSLGMSRQAAK